MNKEQTSWQFKLRKRTNRLELDIKTPRYSYIWSMRRQGWEELQKYLLLYLKEQEKLGPDKGPDFWSKERKAARPWPPKGSQLVA